MPSKSLTSSPASSAIQTPLSNADGPDSASVVVVGVQASGGILGTASGVVPTSMNPKVMETGGVVTKDPAKIKVIDRHGCLAFCECRRIE